MLARTYPGCARSPAAAQALAPIVTTSLRGRPRGRLRGTIAPLISNSPPQTPQGSLRSSAPLPLHHLAAAYPDTVDAVIVSPVTVVPSQLVTAK